MDGISDDLLVEEVIKRFKAKDTAIHDLVAVTKRLEAVNNKLIESERVKTHFLSNIRNEINNPLTTLLTLSRLISMPSDGETVNHEEVLSVCNTIFKEAFNLNFQFQNIFAAAEVESGETALSISNVDMKSLISTTASSFGHKSSEKNITLTLDWKEDGGTQSLFKTDPIKLELVISNLLCNAIEFSHKNGIITVSVWNRNGGLYIAVQDNGIGIDKKDHEVIFDRFRQLDTGMTRSHQGHGLGLSVAKAMMELLNGSITVDSEKGQGATFTIFLPGDVYAAGDDVFSTEGANFFIEEEEIEKF